MMTSDELRKLVEEAVNDGISKIVVGVVVYQGNSLLLLQRLPHDSYPNMYEIPGGGVEPDETLEDAIKRELFEETGMVLHHIRSYVGYFDYEIKELPVRQFNFLVTTETCDVVWHPEHQRYTWVDQNSLDSVLMTSEMYSVVNAALQSFKSDYRN